MQSATDVKKNVNPMKNDAQNTIENAGDAMSEYAHNAGQKVRQFFSTTSTEVGNAAQKVTTEIRNKPVRASLIALGAGFVLGALCRR